MTVDVTTVAEVPLAKKKLGYGELVVGDVHELSLCVNKLSVLVDSDSVRSLPPRTSRVQPRRNCSRGVPKSSSDAFQIVVFELFPATTAPAAT